MSYSTWTSSPFQTYWHHAGHDCSKQEQRIIVQVDPENQFCVSFKEIEQEDSLTVAQRIISMYNGVNDAVRTGSAEELAVFLDEFVLDVESTFSVVAR